MPDLKGQNAIITGASKGIGKAIAKRFAQNGINVVLAARTQGPLDETVAEINSAGNGKAIGVTCDVGSLDDLKNLVSVAKSEFGNIDILINNAGVTSQYAFNEQPIEEFEKLVQTNYLGYIRLIRLVLDDMIERKSGTIINSVSGSTLVDPIPKDFLVYSSLKHGLRKFLKGLFWAMRDYGIKVTTLLPGVTDSDLTSSLKDITLEQKERLMSPEAVVDMVMYALSVPSNVCPLELAVINQRTPWTKPTIDYQQVQAK